MGRIGRRSVVGALAGAAALVAGACTPAGGWGGTDPMSTPRVGHEATLLTSTGRVLVTGGSNGFAPVATAERWDPGTGDWTPVAPMSRARSGHTATELPDGRILVAGGSSTRTAEVYSRSRDSWTATGLMTRPRTGHFAARLTDGTVLVAGPGTTAERYDSATNAWTATGPVPVTAEDPDGPGDEYRVVSQPALDGLVALDARRALALFSWETAHLPDCPGAVCGSTFITTVAVEYAAGTNSWSTAPGPSDHKADAVAVRSTDGPVVASGGYYTDIHSIRSTSRSTEVYGPARRDWQPGPLMSESRQSHTATALADGRVLLVGGISRFDGSGDDHASAEILDPDAGTSTATGSMAGPRWDHEAVRLGDGRVLVVGGRHEGGPLATAEVYVPD